MAEAVTGTTMVMRTTGLCQKAYCGSGHTGGADRKTKQRAAAAAVTRNCADESCDDGESDESGNHEGGNRRQQ